MRHVLPSQPVSPSFPTETARGSGGALKLPQRVRAEPGRQTFLGDFTAENDAPEQQTKPTIGALKTKEMSPEVQTFTVHLWFFQTFLIVQLYNFMIIVHILVSTVYWTELNNDVSNSYYTSDVQARTHDSQSLRVKAQKTQKTSLNHGCIVVLSVHCLFLLSALANPSKFHVEFNHTNTIMSGKIG